MTRHTPTIVLLSNGMTAVSWRFSNPTAIKFSKKQRETPVKDVSLIINVCKITACRKP